MTQYCIVEVTGDRLRRWTWGNIAFEEKWRPTTGREDRNTGRTWRENSHLISIYHLPVRRSSYNRSAHVVKRTILIISSQTSYNIAVGRDPGHPVSVRLPSIQSWSSFEIGFVEAKIPWSWSKTIILLWKHG
jgi:hypothetical protein